jgi:hypothetical protein
MQRTVSKKFKREAQKGEETLAHGISEMPLNRRHCINARKLRTPTANRNRAVWLYLGLRERQHDCSFRYMEDGCEDKLPNHECQLCVYRFQVIFCLHVDAVGRIRGHAALYICKNSHKTFKESVVFRTHSK